MLFDETLIEIFDIDISFKEYSAWQLKCFVMKNVFFFFNFNTDSRISSCARAHYIRYAEGNHQGHRIAFWDF